MALFLGKMAARKPIDEGEFVTLLTRHQAAVYAYILSLHPDRVAAQDIAQETSLVMWRKITDFEKGTNFRAWAMRIAYWQTMAYLKKRKRAATSCFSDELLTLLAGEAEFVLEEHDERRDALKRCLQKLPEGDTSLIQAHYQDGHSVRHLAGRLGKTPAAVKQAMYRIRKQLRSCIERRLIQLQP